MQMKRQKLSFLLMVKYNVYVSVSFCVFPQGHAILENVIEHAAQELQMDPLAFRMKNLKDKENGGSQVLTVIDQLKYSSTYEQRREEIDDFNQVRR